MRDATRQHVGTMLLGNYHLLRYISLETDAVYLKPYMASYSDHSDGFKVWSKYKVVYSGRSCSVCVSSRADHLEHIRSGIFHPQVFKCDDIIFAYEHCQELA